MNDRETTLHELNGALVRRVPLRAGSQTEIGSVIWADDAPTITAHGLKLPQTFDVYVDVPEAATYLIAVSVDADGLPRCTRLTMFPGPHSRGVIDENVRQVRLSDWLQYAIGAVGREVRPLPPGMLVALQATSAGARTASDMVRLAKKRDKFTPQLLQEIANVYRENIHDRPRKRVADHFEIAERTAADWLDRASKAGYLPPTTQGKKRT